MVSSSGAGVIRNQIPHKHKVLWIALLSCISIPLVSCAHVEAVTPATQEVKVAADYTDIEVVAKALASGDVAELHSHFDTDIAAQVSQEMLTGLWDQVVQQMGPYQGLERETPASEKANQSARLKFEKDSLRILLSTNEQNKITGLRLVPIAPPKTAVEPLSANDTITEQDMTFAATNGPEMKGTLTLPKNISNPPAVVLVHGSGAHDRYETLSGNRPFLDLARGLARQGIAVLSYDKRTYTHANSIDINTLTLDQETTDDALGAVQWLRTSGKVNKDRLFVLGHSQGALVTPRILLRDKQIDGGILLAGPAGRLIDVLPHQNRTLIGDQVNTPQGKAHLDMIEGSIRDIRDPSVPGSKTVLGQPASYWRSVDEVMPIDDARKVRQPMLILQGGADFQIIEQDWAPWRTFARQHPKQATFKLYPKLNHLAVETEGKRDLTDYDTPRHVDPQLIKDIADWIKRIK